MHARVINLPFHRESHGFDDSALLEFVRDKQVARLSEHFFTLDGEPYLSCFVQWNGDALAAAAPRGAPGSARDAALRPRRDRSEAATAALDAEGRRIADALRAWRTERARELRVPAYRVLTNRQIEDLARVRPSSADALAQIDGIGPSTVAKHGERVLALVSGAARSSA